MDARSIVSKFLLWWALPTTIAGAALASVYPEQATGEQMAGAIKLGILLGGITMALKAYIRPSSADAILSALALGFPVLLFSRNVYAGGIVAVIAFAINGWRAAKEIHERKSQEEAEQQNAAADQRRAAQQQGGAPGGGFLPPAGDSAVAIEAMVGGRNGVDWRRIHSEDARARMLEQLRALADSPDPQLRARGEIGLAKLVDEQFAAQGVDLPALVAERLATTATSDDGDSGPYVAPRLGVDDAPNGILEYWKLRRRDSNG